MLLWNEAYELGVKRMDKEIVLVDIEQQENAAAVGYIGRDMLFRPAGKELSPLVPPRSETAAALEEAGLYPCDDRNLSDFPFYPVPSLTLFGEDEYGTVYGLVGGCSEDAPVGYVTAEGKYGTAAEHIGAFLQLLNLPGWQKAACKESEPPAFVLYPSRAEAEKEWRFADQLTRV